MLVMRPAQMADLGEVQRLAADSPIGVTSLPDDVERLSDKIAASEASFAAEVSFNGEESYFFVLEDTVAGKLVGCSAIVASAGYSEPFYSFRNETFVHASRELKIHNKIHVLSQCHDLTGNSLLTSFYVVPELVGSAWSELNSRGRLLFVANHPDRFADSVVTEIVGYSDENGDSPFWDAIGRNFFDLNYAAAERLCGLKSRTFLAELMPHYREGDDKGRIYRIVSKGANGTKRARVLPSLGSLTSSASWRRCSTRTCCASSATTSSRPPSW